MPAGGWTPAASWRKEHTGSRPWGESTEDAQTVTDLSVRLATADDAPAVARLVAGLIAEHDLPVPEDLDRTLRRDGLGTDHGFHALLAEREGAAVGVALFYRVYHPSDGRPSLYLEDLYVVPAARRDGAGRRLMAALADFAERGEFANVEWVVEQANDARAFYESLGAEHRESKVVYRIVGDALKGLAAEGQEAALHTDERLN